MKYKRNRRFELRYKDNYGDAVNLRYDDPEHLDRRIRDQLARTRYNKNVYLIDHKLGTDIFLTRVAQWTRVYRSIKSRKGVR